MHLSRSPPLTLISYHTGNDNNNSPSSHFEIIPLPDPPVVARPSAAMKFKTDICFPHIHIVASCNGSVLLSNYSSSNDLVIVCNPLSDHHVILPKPPKLAPLQAEKSVGFGFGYSPATDLYKVLRFTNRLGFDIYTIGIDVGWRSIDTGLPPILFTTNFVFLNGFLHWLGLRNAWLICYFDMEKEQFGSFPLPSHIGCNCRCLEVVDNQLYIHNEHLGEWRFWAMKDYGDFGSWTLEWVIEAQITYRFKGFVRPLKMLKDGTLLMMFNNSFLQTYAGKTTLTSYNPETRVLKEIKFCGILPASVADVPCFPPMDALK
ncbi:hypothetical protein RHMOL_Rhmol04G0066100 [Rhododendron molle]|uniref:Uncharacterized protein n=1 Tax=Rhododendron molle TaxID=49168 RepID=A0ACC0NXN8_RHOML|nr:hypothetical protein RHMOL_Rhmol04G0066100 [Rhododendron molle]